MGENFSTEKNIRGREREREMGISYLVWALYIKRGIRLEKCYIIAGEGENIGVGGLWSPNQISDCSIFILYSVGLWVCNYFKERESVSWCCDRQKRGSLM